MKADYHVHTGHSEDSVCPMDEAVTRAIELGLDEICFTEHVDHGVPTATICNYSEYISDIERCRKKYGDRINIKLGIEFGIQKHTIPDFMRDFDAYDWDFIIMSNHQVDNKEHYSFDFQAGLSVREYTERYYEETLAVIENYEDYSVLGHLDFIRRYDREPHYPFDKLKPVITKILQQAIKQGRGIEINTACYRYNLGDLTPSTDIIMLYRQLGGRIITLGSDAHVSEHIAHMFDDAKQRLRELGFTEFCTYDRMQPVFHSL